MAISSVFPLSHSYSLGKLSYVFGGWGLLLTYLMQQRTVSARQRRDHSLGENLPANIVYCLRRLDDSRLLSLGGCGFDTMAYRCSQRSTPSGHRFLQRSHCHCRLPDRGLE